MYYIQSTGKMDIRLICWEQRPMSYTRNDMLDDKHFLLNLLHAQAMQRGTHKTCCREDCSAWRHSLQGKRCVTLRGKQVIYTELRKAADQA